jgi:prepilin-type N-terminal cleavage/methylation domain-containing protein
MPMCSTFVELSGRRAHRCPRQAAASQSFGLNSAGFTLVEILIAMGILGLVLTAIFSTWTAILRASKTGIEAAAAVQRARIAARTIEESLGSAQAFVANKEYYTFYADNGSDAYLTFVARLSKSFPRGGKFGDFDVRRLTFAVEPGLGGGRDLVLRQNPILMDMDKDEKELPLVLAHYVKEFRTDFWDVRQSQWSDEWQKLGSNTLPAMVKVTLKLADSAYSSQVREEVTRIVNLPSVAVQPIWQASRAPNLPIPPGGPGAPGQPQPGGPGFMPSPVPGGGAVNPAPPGGRR